MDKQGYRQQPEVFMGFALGGPVLVATVITTEQARNLAEELRAEADKAEGKK